MDKLMIKLVIVSLLCISLSTEADPPTKNNNNNNNNRHGSVIRQKKKIISLKKPLRGHGHHHHGRPGRQSNFPPTSTVPSDYSVVLTSESPSVSWKPLTYSVYSEDPLADSVKPTEVSAIANGNIGHIQHTGSQSGTEEQQSTQNEPLNDQEDFTLLQYYIPFEQVISHTKPIVEPQEDAPKKSVLLEKLPKSVDLPTFKKDYEGDSGSEDDNSDFSGKYEYEYFVQDDHWGTNFGHKEYRDGKHTKGDYEVVLPDGRIQHVRYWSDASGYHASVTYHPLFKKFQHV